MSSLTAYASATARDSAAPAASNPGLCIFRTDTNAIEVSDGTNYQTYNSDGVYNTYPSNSYSASFDGNDYITGTVSGLNSLSAFSTSCWFRYQGSLGGATHIMLSGGGGWYVWVKGTTSIEYAFGSTNSKTYTTSTLSNATWYHLATVHDGTSATLYLNGSSLGTQTVNTVGSTAGNTFNIGRYLTGSYYWNGYLDEVALFNRAITSSEVSNIYNNKAYLNPTALYRLENDATDETGTYDLTNNGATFVTSTKPY
jgi:hypothetical protein